MLKDIIIFCLIQVQGEEASRNLAVLDVIFSCQSYSGTPDIRVQMRFRNRSQRISYAVPIQRHPLRV